MRPVTRSAGRAEECVLVVDDEEPARDLARRVLEPSGYRVLTAASLGEAVRVLEQEPVSLVLSDVNMPGGPSGMDLIAAFHLRRPSLPVVFVTGAGSERTMAAALDRGAAGFIAKPYAPADLRAKVAATLTRSFVREQDLLERLLAPTVATALATAIEIRTEGMDDHTDRLSALALELGRRCGLAEPELETLHIGAVLHDVGKIGIPDSILLKPGPITPEERAVIEAHSVIGDGMLAPVQLLESIRPIVRHHHERWDGGGYPDRLEGEAIPLEARIVALADSVEAMTAQRPYRQPLDHAEVVRELELGRGSQWDPRLVDIMLDLIRAGRVRIGTAGVALVDARHTAADP